MALARRCVKAPVGRRRGAMLVIALMFLTLLTLLGVTFAALMKLERAAARNYGDVQTADMVLQSAVDAVAAQLRGAMNNYHFTSFHAPWLFKGRDGEVASGGLSVEQAREEDLFFSGILEPVRGVARSAYRAKVMDCASQININAGSDNLAMMLDNLGEAIQRTRGTNPFHSGRRRVRGDEIVRFRRKLENGRFQSKTALIELLGARNYEIVADFVTAHSWMHASTGKPQDAAELVVRTEGHTGGIQERAGSVYDSMGHSSIYGSQSLGIEPRSPININTASEEVLMAVFSGLACRRPFPFVQRTAVAIGTEEYSAGFAPEGQDRFPRQAAQGGGNEELEYTIRPIWVYTPRIEILEAQRIAREIMAERKRTPFVCWESGRGAGGGGFHEFVNVRLSESVLPRPQGNRLIAIDPLVPNNRQYENALRSGGSGNPAVSSMWGRGHSSIERRVRSQRGLPFHTRDAWYWETVKAGIIANFNPNARLNRSGYNVGAAGVVDKTSLVSPWLPKTFQRGDGGGQASRGEVYCAYTTEFCFDSNGYYEVVALAQLDGQYDASQRISQPRVFRKARAVFKVFEVLEHTTQFDFAQQFNTGRHTSQRGRTNGRYNVMTYPQPLIAATDYMSSGSVIDGSIQMMNTTDAEKVRMPAASRDSYYRGMPNVLSAAGFMFRSATDEARFLMMAQRGRALSLTNVQTEGDYQMGGGVSEFDRLFQSVLDLEYVRGRRLFRERYTADPQRQGRNAVLMGSGGQAGSEAGMYRTLQYPRFSEAFLEGDNLRPDGLHTNIFNAPTTGSGIAMYPAGTATMAGTSWSVGANNSPFPVQSAVGNVAYYQGGIAFWVRFDFDAIDPIFCGLIGCTQVVRDVGPGPQDSEGNQFYVFKTSFGELRVVRMYYHRAFGDTSTHGPGLLPRPPEGEDREREDQVEADPNIAYARSEVLVDISGWKAGEWHHVAVQWNDMEHVQERVRVYLDMAPAESSTGVMYGLIGEGTFCNLNTKVPYDELTIGGIIRRTAVRDAGVFKFAYNLRSTRGGTSAGTADSGPGGVGAFHSPTLKIFPANATIDEFVAFEGTFEGFRSSPLGRTRGYFSPTRGRYCNNFEITFPKGADAVKLRSFTWTEYQPPYYHSPRGVVDLVTTPVSATLVLDTDVMFQRAPWLETSGVAQNRAAGRILRRPTGAGLVDETVKLTYVFDLTAARGTGGYGAAALATPVIDDVTLTYYLPSTQVVVWEELPVDYEALLGRQGGRGVRR